MWCTPCINPVNEGRVYIIMLLFLELLSSIANDALGRNILMEIQLV